MPTVTLNEITGNATNPFSILFDDQTLSIITYFGVFLSIVGIFLTVYYSIRVRHKSIRYAIAQKGDEHIVVLWNSCSQPIFREDIYALSLLASGDFKYIAICRSFLSIPLEVSISDNCIRDDKLGLILDSPTSRIDFSFDFLEKHSGYIVLIQNVNDQSPSLPRCSIEGQIRGEGRSSVSRSLQQFALKGFSTHTLLNFLIIFSCFFGLFLFFVGLFDLIIANTLNTLIGFFYGILSIADAVAFFWVIVTFHHTNKMPHNLRRIYKKYLRSNYKEKFPLPLYMERN